MRPKHRYGSPLASERRPRVIITGHKGVQSLQGYMRLIEQRRIASIFVAPLADIYEEARDA